MDALIPALVAVLLAEIGGKNQALAHRASLAGRSALTILVSLALAAALGLGLAAVGGALIARLLTPDAGLLLAALALLFAGVPMLLPAREKQAAPPPRYLVPALLLAQFGDAAQFIVFALAARGDAPVLAALGGMIGVVAASLPPIVLARDWPGRVPVRTMRLIAAALLIVSGLMLAVRALNLV